MRERYCEKRSVGEGGGSEYRDIFNVGSGLVFGLEKEAEIRMRIGGMDE